MHFFNGLLLKAEAAYASLNGWKKIMINALLFAIPILDLLNEWIQMASGIAALVLLVWSIIKGYYQVELWREDLKMKKHRRMVEEQKWWQDQEQRRVHKVNGHKKQ